MLMYDIWYDRCTYAVGICLTCWWNQHLKHWCLVQQGPLLNVQYDFQSSIFTKWNSTFQVSALLSRHLGFCWLKVSVYPMVHLSKTWNYLIFTNPPWPHIFTSREENSLRRQVGDLLGYHGSSCFPALCSSRHISKTQRMGDIGHGGCELESWWKLLQDLT